MVATENLKLAFIWKTNLKRMFAVECEYKQNILPSCLKQKQNGFQYESKIKKDKNKTIIEYQNKPNVITH